MCSHLGVMHAGQLVAQGTSAEVRAGRRPEAVVETDQPQEAARIMRELGLTEVRTSHISATGNLGRISPDKIVAALRPPGCARPRLPGRRPVPRGRLRLAHRGGLRCQWLIERVGARDTRGRLSHQVPPLRAAADLRSAPQPGRAAGAGQRSRPDLDRGQGLLPGRGGDGPDFFSSITENGLFVALASLTIELGLFLPLAVAAISGDSVAGEANIGTLRYLLDRTGAARPATGGQVPRHRDLLPRRQP